MAGAEEEEVLAFLDGSARAARLGIRALSSRFAVIVDPTDFGNPVFEDSDLVHLLVLDPSREFLRHG